MSDTGLLLPSSSTPLERDLSASMNALPRLKDSVELIRTAKRENIPDSVVPFLIYEYGPGELLPYLSRPPHGDCYGCFMAAVARHASEFQDRSRLDWK